MGLIFTTTIAGPHFNLYEGGPYYYIIEWVCKEKMQRVENAERVDLKRKTDGTSNTLIGGPGRSISNKSLTMGNGWGATWGR